MVSDLCNVILARLMEADAANVRMSDKVSNPWHTLTVLKGPTQGSPKLRFEQKGLRGRRAVDDPRERRQESVVYLQLRFQYLQLCAERRSAAMSEMRSSVNLGGDRRFVPRRNKKGDSFESPSLMPRTGFEPARVATLPPQSSASANSATWAALTSRGIISNPGAVSRV